MSYVPVTAKAEFHPTYKCDLSCLACSRASWLKKPHTPDMTLEDCYEFFRQADAIDWKNKPRNHPEAARILFIGGEPTLHPDFLEMVKICTAWSGMYVQVYSNGYTQKTRDLLMEANQLFAASIQRASWKPQGSIEQTEQYNEATWWFETYVSPADAGLPSPVCYCHPSVICGFSVDHEGYAMCPVGGSVRAMLGMLRTKRLADLFDPEIAARMSEEECRHCGYEYGKRKLPLDTVKRFMEFTKVQPMTEHGCHMSPTWQQAFTMLGQPKSNLPHPDKKRLPVMS